MKHTLLWLACFASASCHRPEQISHLAEACKVALSELRQIRDEAVRPIAVRASPWTWARPREEQEAFLKENPKFQNGPDVPLALAAADLSNVSPVEQCPDVRNWLSQNHILNDDEQIQKETQNESEEFPYIVVSISMPAVAKGGKTAAVYTKELGASLAGGIYVIFYKKNESGSWVPERKIGLAIS